MTEERREKHNAYMREYYATHPEWREKHKAYMREYMREYYKSRPEQYEKRKAYLREHYATHPEFREKKRAYQRARREKKKEEANHAQEEASRQPVSL